MARLARLSLDDGEIDAIRRDLSDILEHVATVQAQDVGDTAPLARPGDRVAGIADLAADEPHAGMPIADLLALAPLVEGPFIAVPKVLGTGE